VRIYSISKILPPFLHNVIKVTYWFACVNSFHQMMSISEADTGRTNDDGCSMLEYSNNSSAKSDEAHKTDGVTGCVDDAEYAMQLLGFTPKTFSDGCMLAEISLIV